MPLPVRSRGALAKLRSILDSLGLEPKEAKTRIVHLQVGGEGLDFLGFHHRLVRARGRTGARRFVFLARWPSRRALQLASPDGAASASSRWRGSRAAARGR